MARRKSIRVNHADRFIADTHFGHALMISERKNDDGSARPKLRDFASIDDHDEHIVDMWNAVVTPTTTVYHLGDFAFWKLPIERVQRIFDRLNGRKNLLIGNHDVPEIESLGWEQVFKGPVHFKDADSGIKFVGSHHPLREWDGFFSGTVHIHGHTHSNLPSSRRSLDVGVDNVGYVPLTVAEIFTLMSMLPELDFRGVPVADFVPGQDGVDDETLAP
jgi:calcineurin-like phosphoesterase family protein